jgi:hypothetical protein
MRCITFAGVASVIAVAICTVPAEAAKRRPSSAASAQSVRGEAGVVVRRSRTRITVTRRSYLDAGTEVYPGSKSYTDYVFSPNYHRPSTDIADPTRSRSLSLPDPFWLNSYHSPNWGY